MLADSKSIGDNKSNGAKGSLAARARTYPIYPDIGVRRRDLEYFSATYRSLFELLQEQTLFAYSKNHNELTPGRAGAAVQRGRLTGPVRFAALLKEEWRLSLSEITRLFGYEPVDESYVEEILDGFTTSPRGIDFKDRVACLYRLHSLLTSLFRGNDPVNEWLRETHPLLDNQSPLQTLLQGSMENMFRVRYLVEHIAGR